MFYGYNPRKDLITIFLDNVRIHIDTFMGNFDNLILIGDFNSEKEEEKMKKMTKKIVTFITYKILLMNQPVPKANKILHLLMSF